MKRTILIAALLALGAPAAAQPPATDQPSATDAPPGEPSGEQARIPFVSSGGIRDFRIADDITVYIEDNRRHWYEATLSRPILVARDWTIGFQTSGTDALDRFSNLIIRGEKYPIASLVAIEGEPPEARKNGEAGKNGQAGEDGEAGIAAQGEPDQGQA